MGGTLITGGTGLVGQRLMAKLQDVTVTSRNRESAKRTLGLNDSQIIEWDYRRGGPNFQDRSFDTIIHLMGESVAKGRWNDAKKHRLHASRVDSTMALMDSIAAMPTKPKLLISASAVGYYADSADREIDEDGAHGSDFLADVAADWEAATESAESLGIRRVVLRIGVILSKDGGALAEMMPIFKWGLGGRLGNGQQYFPWIHIDDLVALIRWAIDDPQVQGIFNASAPQPVTNEEFTKSLADRLNRPAWLPVPEFALKALLGEFAQTLFNSHRMIPRKALDSGFQFRFPNLSSALADLIKVHGQ